MRPATFSGRALGREIYGRYVANIVILIVHTLDLSVKHKEGLSAINFVTPDKNRCT